MNEMKIVFKWEIFAKKRERKKKKNIYREKWVIYQGQGQQLLPQPQPTIACKKSVSATLHDWILLGSQLSSWLCPYPPSLFTSGTIVTSPRRAADSPHPHGLI